MIVPTEKGGRHRSGSLRARGASIFIAVLLTTGLIAPLVYLDRSSASRRPPLVTRFELLALAPLPPTPPRPAPPPSPSRPPPPSPAPMPPARRLASVSLPVAPAPIVDTPRLVPLTVATQPLTSGPASAGSSAAPTAPTAPVVVPPDPAVFSAVNAAPAYPVEARRKREQGTVTLSVEVDATGAVTSVRVGLSSGYRRLDEAALAAVRFWRFAPATRNGAAVAGRGIVVIPFVLTRR